VTTGEGPEADAPRSSNVIEVLGDSLDGQVSRDILMIPTATTLRAGPTVTGNRNESHVSEYRPTVETLGRATTSIHLPGEIVTAQFKKFAVEGRIAVFPEICTWREPGINTTITYIQSYLGKTGDLIR